MEHSFNIEIAEKYGVNCAIIYKNLEFWCLKNKANNKNFYDNNFWTYNSVEAWKKLFPYLGESQIKTALKKLEEAGLIATGNYNKSPYDRTKWFSIIHLAVLANGKEDNIQPIPDNKPDNKPNKEEEEEDFLFLDEFIDYITEGGKGIRRPNAFKNGVIKKLRDKDKITLYNYNKFLSKYAKPNEIDINSLKDFKLNIGDKIYDCNSAYEIEDKISVEYRGATGFINMTVPKNLFLSGLIQSSTTNQQQKD